MRVRFCPLLFNNLPGRPLPTLHDCAGLIHAKLTHAQAGQRTVRLDSGSAQPLKLWHLFLA